jgi:hypothetical protein
MPKHICGQCNQEFETEKEYLDHVCEVSGVNPKDSGNMERHELISKAALERGNTRAKLEKAGKSPEEAIKETREIGKAVV